MRMSEGGGRGAGGKTMAAGRRLLLIYCSLFSLVSMCGFLWVSSSSRGPLSFVMTYDVPESRMTREHTPSADNSSAGRRPQATESVAAFERVLEETTAHTELHTVNKVALPLLPKKDSMPYSGYLKKRVELQKGEWVVKLHSYLLTLNKSVSPHVNMVFGDYKHRRLVLNWITAAVNVIHPPLNNVLVLSLDNLLCELLCNRTLPVACLSVSAGSIFSNELQLGMWLKRLMVRAVLLRVLNYWGYDVASYDSDAVLLKNPQVLYDERPHIDLFSAAGTFPFNVSEKWGFTLCAGTLLYKATPAIGNYDNSNTILVTIPSHTHISYVYRHLVQHSSVVMHLGFVQKTG